MYTGLNMADESLRWYIEQGRGQLASLREGKTTGLSGVFRKDAKRAGDLRRWRLLPKQRVGDIDPIERNNGQQTVLSEPFVFVKFTSRSR